MREEVYTPSFGFDAKRKVWQINGADVDANRIIQLAAMIQAERQERVVGRGFREFTRIAGAVAAVTDVTIEEMIEDGRKWKYALARHLAIYLCKTLTSESLTNVGKYFERHHATVIYAINKVEAMIATKDRDTLIYLHDIQAILNPTNETDD